VNIVDYILSLRGNRILVVSYFINVKVNLIYNIIKKLNNSNICIINFEKLIKIVDFSIEQSCNESSYVIVFEPKGEDDLTMRYDLVISTFEIKAVFDEILKIEKISQSMYKAKNKAGDMFLFKIVNGNIVEESLKPLQETIVSLLKEYGGEVDMSDVVNIISKKYGLSKDATRQELLFLKQLGILDIKNKKVFLTQLL